MDILGIVDVPLYVILVLAAAVLLYIYGTWNHAYFKKRGIPGPTPYPLVGNMTGIEFFHTMATWRQQFGNVFESLPGCSAMCCYISQSLPGAAPCVVIISQSLPGAAPCVVISDLDILKEVLAKSSNVFRNRKKFALVPYPFSLGLFFLDDAPWKRVRSIITPTFSSRKLRQMCIAINDCAETLTSNFSKVIGKQEGVNVKQYFGAFTVDVISRTAFGIKVDSQNDFSNPFVTNVKQMFTPPRFIRPILLLNGYQPLPLQQRTDFLQLLMDAGVEEGQGCPGKHSVRRLSTDEIVAQGTVFYVAGYEAVSSTLNFASHYLATNPDEEPNYDNIGKLKYLDNVITETLRICPPVIVITRRASETIRIKHVTIHEGQTVFIPVFALQRDPQLFKDPNVFKPERHDEKSNPLSFLAFGYGPRICIGMRLARVEMKIALVHVLRRVKFERMPNTQRSTGSKDVSHLLCLQDELAFKKINTLKPAEDIVLRLSHRC
ncbi:cytochrome P450 3A29-like [Haliotis rubra]|uniref:cytochrome P450 3A29-like n=1 Tax=Haliotis rubra TaxID=36100 RepID=UPI001EE549EF|nr:cytochrome P450 3A29-like [Haliotis rubra]